MGDLLGGLNEAQKCAVTSPASVLQILAPPGSGKTKTLTTRVAYLIAHRGLDPRNIIVCTFTVKAAREMKERIRSFLGDDLASRLMLGTFHSVARRYLAKYGERIGIDPKFGIADSSDSLSIVSRILKRVGSDLKPAQARSRISRMKSQCLSAAEMLGSKKVEQQEFAMIYSAYEDALKLSNLLDYDDLLLRCADLMRLHPNCTSDIEAVLIDEYQDTNNVQYDLMTLFAQKKNHITIVGDPDQSIYGFRSAEIKNLTKMQQQYQDTVVINLEENYRSAGSILLAASEVIEQDVSRPPKRLKPTHSIGLQPVLRQLPSASAEAFWIVSEIQRTSALTGHLLKWSDYAVLLRSASLSRLIETALGKAGLPYRMVGGHRFFDRMEVKLLLDYLRVINHPDHNDALARVINVPSRKIGDVSVAKLLKEADEKKITLWRLILDICRGDRRPPFKLSSQAERGLQSFTNLILKSRKRLAEPTNLDDSLRDFVQVVVEKIGLREHLKKTREEDFESRWGNVEELLALASDFGASSFVNEDNVVQESDQLGSVTNIDEALTGFLANVALSTEVQKEDDQNGDQAEQITLSTIHAAKGLEWPVVFVPAAYEGSIPHSRAEDNDEERRLLYVAMTRAQSMLYLSCPKWDSKNSQTTLSNFLSQKPMPSYLASRGSNITFDDVNEIAGILRRICPSSRDIHEARKRLDTVKDDGWPTHDENENRYSDDLSAYREAESERNNTLCFSNSQNNGHKRRRMNQNAPDDHQRKPYSREDMWTQIKHGNPERRQKESVANTTFTTTFMTATAAMQRAEQAREELSRKKIVGDGCSSVAAKDTDDVDRKTGQQTLGAFFVRTRPAQGLGKPIVQEKIGSDTSGRPIALKEVTNVNLSQNFACAKVSGSRMASTTHVTSVATVTTTVASTTMMMVPQRRTLGMRRSLNGWQARKCD